MRELANKSAINLEDDRDLRKLEELPYDELNLKREQNHIDLKFRIISHHKPSDLSITQQNQNFFEQTQSIHDLNVKQNKRKVS